MPNLVEVAVNAGNFQTLVKAVQAAGLEETLAGSGPLTVFAPTDEAFAKLPEGTVEGLLSDKEQLTKVLTYHVVSGKVTAADAQTLSSAKTVEGGELSIDTSDGVRVGGARVIQADIEADNGVIHVIDSVLLPG
ncbi:fasciclin domain-containing protein [Truepera radiovictrix]|uniref:Beta-Ig-H3/fasciclin n=1 Tax=Truepera radiovictrix (strain DSM 17093 / CIP 108686 / LMG 22925 / RQ-24) TaxID=649638 RepID=D7CUX8_TRURR|nr:fasciclin domain-containing protein [Truepera radiovictrix]ADI15805.1 beta-Ig-H3/fasciclin [Truepera radiovictrix DSM 17093]WMT58567.1 fasciclin domain-containing protein [Truepera radiovictrix]